MSGGEIAEMFKEATAPDGIMTLANFALCMRKAEADSVRVERERCKKIINGRIRVNEAISVSDKRNGDKWYAQVLEGYDILSQLFPAPDTDNHPTPTKE